MLLPEGESQDDVLASGDALPYLSLAGFSGTLIHSWDDEVGDDHGPGSYTYPTTDEIPEDTYDITNVELYETSDRYRFVYYLNGPITNPWSGGRGFSLHNLQVYVRDPRASSLPATIQAHENVNVTFRQPYHYRIIVNGYDVGQVINGNNETITQDITAQAHPDIGAITFEVPQEAFERDIRDHQFAPLLLSHDGFRSGGVRAVKQEREEYAFGGGIGANDPAVIDMITPEGVSQSDALAHSADQQAQLPYVPEIEGEPGQPIAVASVDGPAFATTDVELDGSGSSDPEAQDLTDEWTQTAGPDVALSEPTGAQPTFTAPDVDGETDLAFELSVSDPDGNEATDTVTVTIRPQSANDAPIADAGEDRTVDPGETISLQAVDSEDPNGGSLSFQWAQTGRTPEVELTGADSVGAAFTAPEVDGDTTLTFEVTVDDGQGKTTTDTVNVTVRGTGETTTETGDGFGPGFGVVSGALGTAGGLAYAGKSLLDDESKATDDATGDNDEQ